METTSQTPQITVYRQPSEKDWTLSKFSINGIFMGVGVEDEFRKDKVHGETRIPNGIYEIELVPSPKFSKYFFMDKDGFLNNTQTARFDKPHLLIHVKNVPNFEGILWHWGNTDDDTDGCYVVGSNFATFGVQKGVSASKIKYIEVYPIIFKLYQENFKIGKKTFVEYKDAAQ